jgi:RNA-splicing ligase RtcB
MQNFSAADVMRRLAELEEKAERHVPAGVGSESDLAERVSQLEIDVDRINMKLFDIAGVGAAQASGATVDSATLAAEGVGTFTPHNTTVAASTETK